MSSLRYEEQMWGSFSTHLLHSPSTQLEEPITTPSTHACSVPPAFTCCLVSPPAHSSEPFSAPSGLPRVGQQFRAVFKEAGATTINTTHQTLGRTKAEAQSSSWSAGGAGAPWIQPARTPGVDEDPTPAHSQGQIPVFVAQFWEPKKKNTEISMFAILQKHVIIWTHCCDPSESQRRVWSSVFTPSQKMRLSS